MKPIDFFKIKNIRNYIDGNLNFIKFSNDIDVKTHILEQAFYRLYLCQDCYLNKSCTECGCSTPEMFFAPKKEDAKGKWGVMLEDTEWQLFKIENNIDINKLEIELPEDDVEDSPFISFIKELKEKTKDETER